MHVGHSPRPQYMQTATASVELWWKHFMMSLDALIRGRVGAQDQQFALSLHFAGDLYGFRDQIEHLLVDRLIVGGREQKVNRRADFLADEQDGGMPPLMQRIAQSRCGSSWPGFITPR